MTEHTTGTREESRKARIELLELEKVQTRRGDELARMRRELPYQLLDRAPKGRDEDNIPAGHWWWRRHDEYENDEGRTWPSG